MLLPVDRLAGMHSLFFSKRRAKPKLGKQISNLSRVLGEFEAVLDRILSGAAVRAETDLPPLPGRALRFRLLKILYAKGGLNPELKKF